MNRSCRRGRSGSVAAVVVVTCILMAAPARAGDPLGACCFGSSCVEITELDCIGRGGLFLGPGTLCEGTICYSGACCLFKGEPYCVEDLVELQCLALGGTWFGAKTTCLSGICVSTGACCLPAGACTITSLSECGDLGGLYIGDDTTCFKDACTFGACCLAGKFGPVCFDGYLGVHCAIEGGEFLGAGSRCGKESCAVEGACCFGDSCASLTLLECIVGEGVFLGEGTICEVDTCTPGACCLQTSVLELVCFDGYLEALCVADDGTWLGAGSACFFGACDPMGACCFSRGACVVTSQILCEKELGGTYVGDGTSCAGEGCPEGACCFTDTSCLEVVESDCHDLGGAFEGLFTSCGAIECIDEVVLEPPVITPADGEPIIETTADFDLDGFLDVAVVIPAGPGLPGFVQVFMNEGTAGGTWLGFAAQAAIMVGIDPNGISAGLLDSDSLPDIAVSNGGDDTVSVLLNLGAGAFGPPTPYSFPEITKPGGIASADVTADGRDDLAVSSGGNDTVVLLTNITAAGLGGAAFIVGDVADVEDDPTVIDPEDVDNDRDVDLVVNGRGGNKASVVPNGVTAAAGGSIFLPAVQLPVGDMPVDLALCDLDDNGFPDIVTANHGDGTLSVILNLGGLVFGTAMNVPVGDMPRSVAPGDFDGDGDCDLVALASDPEVGHAVRLLENLGGAIFGAIVSYGAGGDPNWIEAGDLDNNGLADVVTVNGDDDPTGGAVSTLLNETGPPPCPADLDGDGLVSVLDVLLAILAIGPCPEEGPCPADLDGDGDVDFDDVALVVESLGPCPANRCPADFGGDGDVGMSDLLILLSAWGPCEGACDADLNGNGEVGMVDLLILLGSWGECSD
jgi:hypothetical protein